MGTRGFFGYIKRGKIKGVFCNNDSYVRGLGFSILEKLIPMGAAKVRYFFDNKLVFVEDAPEDQLVDAWDLMTVNWQARGKKFQAIDAKDFLNSTMWCEYAYLYSFKYNQIQCYAGGLEDEPFATIKLTMGLKEAKLRLLERDKERKDAF